MGARAGRTALLLVCAVGLAEAKPPRRRVAPTPAGPCAILVTLDGVRWQEVFQGTDPGLGPTKGAPTLPLLLKKRPGTLLFGDPGTDVEVTIANGTSLSLPGYLTLLTGKKTRCANNRCDRVGIETLPERLVRELHLPARQVATLTSWELLAHAVEHVQGATFVNAGRVALDDGHPDARSRHLNQAERDDPPRKWARARFDAYTMAHALRYLRLHRPRYLHIGLNDADEWGHLGDYATYIKTLRRYDGWLRQLLGTLGGLGAYGKRCSVVVTTDHGRGTGAEWIDHRESAAARRVWLWVHGPLAQQLATPPAGARYSHLDLRPTVERLFGLAPCDGCTDGLPLRPPKRPRRR